MLARFNSNLGVHKEAVAFIVLAKNNLPALIKELRRLQAEVEGLKPVENWRQQRCQNCGCGIERHTGLPTTGCNDCECLEFVQVKEQGK